MWQRLRASINLKFSKLAIKQISALVYYSIHEYGGPETVEYGCLGTLLIIRLAPALVVTPVDDITAFVKRMNLHSVSESSIIETALLCL